MPPHLTLRCSTLRWSPSLPEPARRYLTHAIAAGTPLWQSVQVSMVGHIKLGAWRPFTATQVVAPSRGYIWAANAQLFGIPVIGYDRLSAGPRDAMAATRPGARHVHRRPGHRPQRRRSPRIGDRPDPDRLRGATWTAGDGPDTAVATWGARRSKNASSCVSAQPASSGTCSYSAGATPTAARSAGTRSASPWTGERTDAGVTTARHRAGRDGGAEPTVKTPASSSAPRSPPSPSADGRQLTSSPPSQRSISSGAHPADRPWIRADALGSTIRPLNLSHRQALKVLRTGGATVLGAGVCRLRTNGHTHHMQKVSLDALARQQIALAGSAGGGHTADTVFGGHEKVLRQTVIGMVAGARLAEHNNPGEATVLVLNGHVRLAAADLSWEGHRGDLLIVPDSRHSLEAVEDSAVLLTVAKTLR